MISKVVYIPSIADRSPRTTQKSKAPNWLKENQTAYGASFFCSPFSQKGVLLGKGLPFPYYRLIGFMPDGFLKIFHTFNDFFLRNVRGSPPAGSPKKLAMEIS